MIIYRMPSADCLGQRGSVSLRRKAVPNLQKELDGEKASLRKEILARRDRLSAAHRVFRSAEILQRLFELGPMAEVEWVHFYVSHGSEVETTGMIAHALAAGKKVAVPKREPGSPRLVLSELRDPVLELIPSSLGIPEPRPEALRPVEPSRIGLFVIPGSAFDEAGNRLGRGAGCYDRLLSTVKGKSPIVGLGFEFQVVRRVPAGPLDIGMDWVVTEKRVIECKR